MPRMVLKITNLHILRYLPTCWLFLLERYTIDNQRCTHTASESAMAKLATLPRQQEWEDFVSIFQQCRKGELAKEKWSMMERMFYLYE